MADRRRILRLQQLILEVVAETLQAEVRDPRMGLVTITRVKLSKDLSRAVVYWSSLGDEKEHRLSAQALEAATPLLQRRVAKALQTRITPHLKLIFDPTLERAQRLETIFHHLQEERGEPEEAEEETAGDAADVLPPPEA
jgi:ribosome-binding factor A